MALVSGNASANTGMAKTIYDSMNDVLKDDLEGLSDEDKKPIRDNWKKLAFAIASGVIEHLKSNLEIHGVEVSISDISTTVSTVTTCPAGAGSGTGSGSGTATGQQSNDGTGHVK